MATATKSKKSKPTPTSVKRRRTKPGEVKARHEKPAPISLPQLEWISTDDKGVVHRHQLDNPVQNIVNKFNEHHSQFGTVASLPAPEPEPEPELSGSQWARKLERLTDGEMSITFEPDVSFEGDDEAEGHLFSGHLSCENNEDDFISLDARKGDLPGQLADELLRISRMYADIASKVRVESKRARWQVWLLEEQSPSVVIYNADNEIDADGWMIAFQTGDIEPIAVAVKEGEPVPSWMTAHRLRAWGDRHESLDVVDSNRETLCAE